MLWAGLLLLTGQFTVFYWLTWYAASGRPRLRSSGCCPGVWSLHVTHGIGGVGSSRPEAVRFEYDKTWSAKPIGAHGGLRRDFGSASQPVVVGAGTSCRGT